MATKYDPNNVTVNFTLKLDDENPKIRRIAAILRDGLAIDRHGLHVTKGRALCIYALTLLDHLENEKSTTSPQLLVEKQEVSPTVQSAHGSPDALAGMGLEDFVNG